MTMRKMTSLCMLFILVATMFTGVGYAEDEAIEVYFEVSEDGEVSALGAIGPQANPIIQFASASLTSSKTITFTLTANQTVNVSVSSCSLQVKSNGKWVSAGSVSLPASKSTSAYGASSDVSSLISSGNTYRVSCTFKAGTESVNRSHERTY